MHYKWVYAAVAHCNAAFLKKCLAHFTQQHIKLRGSPDTLHGSGGGCYTGVVVGSLGDVLDGTAACMPDNMPGFI